MKDKINLTFGAELEIADWDRTIEIPKEIGVIDKNDISICNSNGVGINPYKQDGFGGEICTNPHKTTSDLVNNIINIYDHLGHFNINYSCWLHIHVGFDNKKFTLQELKSILKKVHKANKWIPFTNLSPTKQLDFNESIIMDDINQEMLIRRNLTRTSRMTEEEYNTSMNANTIEEFWKPFSRKRHLINIQSLLVHNTIEFRFFYMTTDRQLLLNNIDFCMNFCNYLLYDTPLILSNNYSKSQKINIEQEKVYIRTICDKREKVDNFI